MATAVVSPTFKRLSLLIPNFSVRLRTKFYPRAFISKLAKRNSEFGLLLDCGGQLPIIEQ